jgi:hypothetical protein
MLEQRRAEAAAIPISPLQRLFFVRQATIVEDRPSAASRLLPPECSSSWRIDYDAARRLCIDVAGQCGFAGADGRLLLRTVTAPIGDELICVHNGVQLAREAKPDPHAQRLFEGLGKHRFIPPQRSVRHVGGPIRRRPGIPGYRRRTASEGWGACPLRSLARRAIPVPVPDQHRIFECFLAHRNLHFLNDFRCLRIISADFGSDHEKYVKADFRCQGHTMRSDEIDERDATFATRESYQRLESIDHSRSCLARTTSTRGRNSVIRADLFARWLCFCRRGLCAR